MPDETWIEWAKIGRPHGLRGEVRLFVHNPDSDAIFDVANVRIVGANQPDSAWKPSAIDALRPGPKGVIARFKGVQDRTGAEALTNARVLVPRSTFPDLDREEDGYYAFELEGLQVVDAQGTKIGHVESLVDFGAGEMLSVRHGGDHTYVPFAAPYVATVDLEAGTVEIDLTDLLDE